MILCRVKPLAASTGILLGALTNAPATAHAKTVCGHYAIAFCAPDRKAAETFANGGWGSTIATQDYAGLRTAFYCVVSGPHPQASAERDRAAAITNGVSPSTYIKRACTDDRNIGD
jgi:hypothetical protein